MPILILLLVLAVLLPRVTIAVLWFLTGWFTGVFATVLWPLLGFIFLPYTLLWYSVVVNLFGGVWGPFQIIGAILAVALDLSSSGYGYTGYRRTYIVEEEVV